MEELAFKMVQGQIGYVFKNPNLLKQAFVRRSYTSENGGENNEVLEFFGDRALEYAVVRMLAAKYGRIDEKNEFVSALKEGKLTMLKSQMVEKKTLARRMDELGFSKYLVVGKSDIRNNTINAPSVKEDLFEAIIGAVAIDCGWNSEDILSVVEVMLEPDTFFVNNQETNYVRLIQKWEMQKNGVIPLYKYEEGSYTATWYMGFDGISQNIPAAPATDYSKLRFRCLLKLLDSLPVFRGFGASKSEARMAVCKVAYEYLKNNDMLFSIRDEIDDPKISHSINQLETLARRGNFSVPTYNFEEEHDSNGNPVWKCECHIEEYDISFNAKSSSKKEAKKHAAFEMLKYVLNDRQ